MPTFKDENIVDIISQQFESRGVRLSENLFDAVFEYILSFETESGKIVKSGTNKRTIAEINALLKSFFEEKFLDSYIPNLTEQLGTVEKNDEFLQAKENDFTPSAAFKAAEITPIRQLFADNVFNELGLTGFSQQAGKPIIDLILTASQSGYTLQQTKSELSKITDSFGRYTGQVVRDTMFGYDGQVNNVFATAIGANAYKYSGSIVKDSRPQCRRWVKMKIITFEQLSKEIAWGNQNGSGMRPNTNKSNFTIKRGGYNCRHKAIPVKIDE